MEFGDNLLEDQVGVWRIFAGAGRQDTKNHCRRDRSADGPKTAGPLRQPGKHHQRKRHRYRIAGRRVQRGGVVHTCCITSHTAKQQARLFADTFRVLRSGGVFAGNNSLTSLLCHILNCCNICNHVSPKEPPDRLHIAGFHDVDVRHDTQRWHAITSDFLASRSTFCKAVLKLARQNVDLDLDL